MQTMSLPILIASILGSFCQIIAMEKNEQLSLSPTTTAPTIEQTIIEGAESLLWEHGIHQASSSREIKEILEKTESHIRPLYCMVAQYADPTDHITHVAHYKLGLFYEHIDTDYDKALTHYRQATQVGDALFRAGLICYHIEKNYYFSNRLFKKALTTKTLHPYTRDVISRYLHTAQKVEKKS